MYVIRKGKVERRLRNSRVRSNLTAPSSLNSIVDEQKDAGWGVLLLDAPNAFNALNWKAALWQARHLWPPVAVVFSSTRTTDGLHRCYLDETAFSTANKAPHRAMGLVRITSWYPNFNGSHFGLPPSEIYRMTGLPPKIVRTLTMTYSHRPHPLSMAFYTIGILPPIRDLNDLQRWAQVCYADNKNCAGKLKLLRVWLETHPRRTDLWLRP